MCLLIVNKKGLLPYEQFKTAAENNPDGSGFAIYDSSSKKVVVHKTMAKNLCNMYKKYKMLRKINPDSPAVIHFRVSTYGGVNLNNTHPFVLTNGCVLAHNGVVSGLYGYDKNKSDTNMLAHIMSVINADDLVNDSRSHTILKLIAGATNKFAVMHPNGKVLIIGESLGHWVGETWYSNHGYLKQTYFDYGGTRVDKKSSKDTPYTGFKSNYGSTAWSGMDDFDGWNHKEFQKTYAPLTAVQKFKKALIVNLNEVFENNRMRYSQGHSSYSVYDKKNMRTLYPDIIIKGESKEDIITINSLSNFVSLGSLIKCAIETHPALFNELKHGASLSDTTIVERFENALMYAEKGTKILNLKVK